MSGGEEARRGEEALLSPEVRRDPARVRALLAEGFVEIGRSGRLWGRDEIVAALAAEEGREHPETSEWAADEVAPGLVLVTYRVHGAERDSRHSSLWEVGGEGPRVRFHQGTYLT
ncbi:DUF4440 domain-containing protein [Herbiconiux sp. CPCC 205716]|uniref:DUF4440 domain-containing protein n=1 Tax=Herbiconiux gentiana TaxID=2970912 RepID=A0ABT2GBW9_9MICO|nr:DUF4440 domain-containing protein [Herbiconiux gentiana]MCS5713699.1 DUF4440 domain-containing protein [Herbiconiux gentiana]